MLGLKLRLQLRQKAMLQGPCLTFESPAQTVGDMSRTSSSLEHVTTAVSPAYAAWIGSHAFAALLLHVLR